MKLENKGIRFVVGIFVFLIQFSLFLEIPKSSPNQIGEAITAFWIISGMSTTSFLITTVDVWSVSNTHKEVKE